MVAKLADFGVSKISPEPYSHISTRPVGTMGYVAAAYFLHYLIHRYFFLCLHFVGALEWANYYLLIKFVSLTVAFPVFQFIYRYVDPEYFRTNQVTVSSDIYSFGIVLLEIITGKPIIDDQRGENTNLEDWVRSAKYSACLVQPES